MGKEVVKIFLALGIISGEQKRLLEGYVNAMIFKQRKSYDEYYVKYHKVETLLSLDDLHLLSEEFDVEVFPDNVTLTSD